MRQQKLFKCNIQSFFSRCRFQIQLESLRIRPGLNQLPFNSLDVTHWESCRATTAWLQSSRRHSQQRVYFIISPFETREGENLPNVLNLIKSSLLKNVCTAGIQILPLVFFGFFFFSNTASKRKAAALNLKICKRGDAMGIIWSGLHLPIDRGLLNNTEGTLRGSDLDSWLVLVKKSSSSKMLQVTNPIDLLQCRQKNNNLIASGVLLVPSKLFVWAFNQMDTVEKTKWFKKNKKNAWLAKLDLWSLLN